MILVNFVVVVFVLADGFGEGTAGVGPQLQPGEGEV